MHLANPEGTPGTKPKRASRSPFFDNGAGVSNWRLQRWFYPDGNKPPLTYHPDRKRWRRDANHAYLQSVGRGQEFSWTSPTTLRPSSGFLTSWAA